jgi:hypothetical protein
VLVFPLLTAALPLLDAALAMVRRLRSRASVLSGDRRHLYDLIMEQGWPAHRIAGAFYGATATLAAIGLFGVRSESPQFWAIAAISLGLLLYVVIRLGSLRGDTRVRPAQDSSARSMEEEYGEPTQTG